MSSRFSIGWNVVILVALLPLPALAHDSQGSSNPVPTLRAAHARGPLVVDGRLDDAAWSEAVPATEFRQRDPDEGKPATERTELRVVYDEASMYFGWRLLDSEPARISRRLTRRDDYVDTDRIVLYLDPHHDHRTGFVFNLSAAGVQGDGVLYNDSWDDDSWDGVWESAVTVDQQGWSVEMRIPFSQLRFHATEQQTWGINASRYIQRKNETVWLELVPKKESGIASRMAHLTGLDGIHPGRHAELRPYVVGRSEFVKADAGDPFNDGSRAFGSLGVDLKYGLTSSLTLDATLNPDFGQVEVDPAVVNLSDFETFFREKRPFFIEGAPLYDNFGRSGSNSFWGFDRAEPNLFYSRRIGRSPQGAADGDFVDRPTGTTILGAAKLSGQTAGWKLGVLEALTARESAQVVSGPSRARREVEPLTSHFATRAFREIGRGGVGFLATAVHRDLRDFDLRQRVPRSAYVGGIDAYRFLDGKKDWVVTGRLAGSFLEGSKETLDRLQHASARYYQRPDASHVAVDPDATTLSGWTGSMNLNRNAGNLKVNAALWGVSPGFESNDLGFQSRSDRWGSHAVFQWQKTEPDRLTRRRVASFAKSFVWNFAGDEQADGLHLFANAQFRNYWWLGADVHRWARHFDDRLTRGGPSVVLGSRTGGGLFVETDSRKTLFVAGGVSYGASEFGDRSAEVEISFHVKPSAALSLSLSPEIEGSCTVAKWVQNVEDEEATSTFGHRYVFAELKQTELSLATRLNWTLSPRMSLQLYVQPLVSAGDYRGFKELARGRSFDFLRYGENAGTLSFDSVSTSVTVDPDGAGPAAPFSFDDPDFNFKSLRVNAIFRWEFRLGSTLYVAWTQSRENDAHPGQLDLWRDAGALFGASDDVFLVKVAYRLGR